MSRMFNPPHPGATLGEDILPALGLTVTDAARQLGITRTALSRILNGHAGIFPEMARRIESWLGPEAGSRASARRRSKLKIFFGASPGVRKTCAMLVAVRKLRDQLAVRELSLRRNADRVDEDVVATGATRHLNEWRWPPCRCPQPHRSLTWVASSARFRVSTFTWLRQARQTGGLACVVRPGHEPSLRFFNVGAANLT